MPHTAPVADLESAWSQPWTPLDPVAVASHWFDHPAAMAWLDSSLDGHHLIGIGEHTVQTDSIDAAETALRDDPGPWLGWFGYEAGAERLVVQPRRDPGSGVAFVRLDRWVVIAPDGSTSLHARTPELAFELPPLAPVAAHLEPELEPVAAHPRESDADYLAKIERCLQHLRAGDAWVLCLTTAFTSGPIDPLASHVRLRRLSPVPRGGLLRIGGITVSSASMEQFVTVADGWVTTSPIKGTRPRADDPHHDRAHRDELRSSEKERAENVMIVDLCRNDLGRICRPGSISVPHLLQITSYATVHQLSSTIVGRLDDGLGPMDAVRALFPAGSMTGAPKQRAIEILTDLEGSPRGVYSGCFGLISGDRADLAMVIRSVVSTPDGAHLGVGGGITVLSDPDDEVAEVHLKAEALRRCLRPPR